MTTIREQTIIETADGVAYLVRAMVNWADIVTTKFIEKNGGVWDINDQIAHVHSEISEVFQALRHNEGSERVFEEAIDTLFSAITLLTIIRLNQGITKEALNEKINECCLKVTKKIYKRAGIPIK